ncbi:hypothetical protein ACKFKF_16595 [Phormidesmis sp. 146-12]
MSGAFAALRSSNRELSSSKLRLMMKPVSQHKQSLPVDYKSATENNPMTHSISQRENYSEHEILPQTDSLHDSKINYALIAIAQEVAELLKQSYLLQVQADKIDSVEVIDGNNFAE